MGLAILGRANAIILLAAAGGGGLARAGGRPLVLVRGRGADGRAVDDPQLRHVLDAFVPVSTQFGSALAGTYNSEAQGGQARTRRRGGRLKRVDDYRPIYNRIRTDATSRCSRSSCARRRSSSSRSTRRYVLTVAYWTTRRMLDLAGMDWSIHTAATISASAGGRSRA